MPTWLTHFMVAERCEAAISPESRSDYIVGVLAPDSGKMLDFKVFEPPATITHWTEDGKKRNSDYIRFYDTMLRGKETSAADRSFLLGYFVHLATDNLWFRFLMNGYEQRYIKKSEDRRILGEGIKKDFIEYERQKIAGCCRDYVKLLKGIDRYSNDTLPYLSDELLTDRVKGASDYFDWLKNDRQPYEMQYTTVQELDDTIALIADEIKKYMAENIKEQLL